MVSITYFFEIDKHWNKIKNWWNNIIIVNDFIPIYYQKIDNNLKYIFNIKLLFIIKQIFKIEDLSKINKINIQNYNIEELIQNIINNKDNLKLLIEDDNELKNNVKYILKYNKYFNNIKLKVVNIIKPLLTDIYSNELFTCNDDLTRLFGPIVAYVVHIFILTKNIKKTIKYFISLDIVALQFFIVSYLIIDNIMDKHIESDKYFLKWFINIINNPNNEIILNTYEKNIWQCNCFKKYYNMFIEKYPIEDNKILYDYVKLMVSTLIVSDKIQKNKDNTEEIILEYSFKKSYFVFFFILIILSNQFKFKINKKNFYILSKLVFLIQLYDDCVDLNKDINENNYTYFNINNSNLDNSKLDNIDSIMDNKIKKLIIGTRLLIDEIDIKDNNMKNILNYLFKILYLSILYTHNNLINNNLKKYYSQYSLLDTNILKLFDANYDIYNDNTLISLLKKCIIIN
jgi:hypothetical protein